MKRVIAGPRAVREALRASAADLAVVYLARNDPDSTVIRQDAERTGVRWERATARTLDALAGEVRHQGVVAIGGQYTYRALDQILDDLRPSPILLALDQVTDPQNFGAMTRSAVALGTDAIIILKDRACPVTAAVVRASAGATELATICRITNLARTLTALSERNMQVVGLDADGEVELAAVAPCRQGRVLVVGSEGRGLRRLVRERCDVIASIPLSARIGSLNASVAAGIALYESERQRAAMIGGDA